jgi:MYXO-CTERM domain-containing protein
VTSFKAGQQVTVQWEETVAHDGWFRIALSYNNRADLHDPTVQVNSAMVAIDASVVDPPVLPVLADHLYPHTAASVATQLPKAYSYTVTLPAQTCAKCTLQLIQFMGDHGPNPSNTMSGAYIYHHCADISIQSASTDGGSDGNPGKVDGGKDASPSGAGGSGNAGAGGSSGATGGGGTGAGGEGTTGGSVGSGGSTTAGGSGGSGVTSGAGGSSNTGGSSTTSMTTTGGSGGSATTTAGDGSGTANTGNGGGCSCSVAGRNGSSWAPLAGLAAIALAMGRRRRRRSSERSTPVA